MAEPTVDTLGSAQERMHEYLEVVNAAWGGTKELRDLGTLFLPRHTEEKDDNYDRRLESAVCFNQFKKCVQAMAGRPFHELPQISGMPEELEYLLDDIDMLGHSFLTVAHDLLEKGLWKGFVAVLADMPPLPEGATLADQRDPSNRPYWKVLLPEDFIAGYCEVREGREVFTHVRLAENSKERFGAFGEREVCRVRVIESDWWWLYEKTGESWEIRSEGPNPYGEVPIRVWYSGERLEPLCAEPPLLDLAYLNISHWQSSADQDNILTVARFPMLAFFGVSDYDSTTIGPSTCFKIRDPNASAKYVEHTGAAIAAGQRQLEVLEARMAALGVELLVKSTGDRRTATGRTLDDSQANSPLQAMAKKFAQFLSSSLTLLAKIAGMPPEGKVTVELETDFGIDAANQVAVNAILELGRSRLLRPETVLSELKRRNILSNAVDAGEEAGYSEEYLPHQGPEYPEEVSMVDGPEEDAGAE